MKVLKSLLLGSAAGIAAVATASAADLPSRKSAPAEYVRICDAYGAGFFYIPGTDTCLRVGGYVRFETGWVQSGNIWTVPAYKALSSTNVPVTTQAAVAAPAPSLNNVSFIPGGVQDQSGFMGRGRIDIDARTQTQWGTARTFIALRAAATSGVYGPSDNYITGALTGQSASVGVTVENAIVQFAGFTFGRTTAELFSFMPAYNYNSFAWSGFPGAITMLAYTATFGGGFSATLGVEDRAGLSYSFSPGPGYMPNTGAAIVGVPVVGSNTAAFTGAGVLVAGATSGQTGNLFVNGPVTWPALVGNLRLDQGWGAIQVMGAIVQNAATSQLITPNTTTVVGGGSPNFTLTQIGWSIGAGVKLNLDALTKGDSLYVTAAYSNGDLDHLAGSNTSASTANWGKEFNGLQRVDRNMYVTPSAGFTAACSTAGGVTSGCFRTEQTSGWSAGYEFTHYWTPTLRSVFLGSYISLNPGNITKNTDWTLGGLSNANVIRLAGQLVWSPTKDLNIGGELTWQQLNAKLTGTNGAIPSCMPGNVIAGCAATGVPNASSQVWQARMRVERLF